MPTGTFEYTTEQERMAIESAIAFVAEMHSLAQSAPPGQILSACEEHGLEQGRDFLRKTLQRVLQDRILLAEQITKDATPKKKETRGAASNAPDLCVSNDGARRT